jgi:transcriptional regulator with XRE-family HTH domain
VPRHPQHTSPFRADDHPRRYNPAWCEWAGVVGDRVRRLRTARNWTLFDLARPITSWDGRALYSVSHYSRLERGWATAPIYTYLAVAAVLEVEPGRLLGPDSAMLEASESELTLLKALRELGIAPHEALVQLAQARSTAMRSSSPSMCVESPPPS